MLPSTRRSRSSSSLQHQRVNVPLHVHQQNADATHQALEDAIESTPFNLQGRRKSLSTMGIQLNNMLQNFYIKTTYIIIQSRRSTKSDMVSRWFSLVVTNAASLRAELHFWKSKIYYPCEKPPPILAIHILLDTTHLSRQEVCDIMGDYIQQGNWNHGKKKIILESWSLVCRQSPSPPVLSSSDLPNFYKQSIIFFRALHSFTRLLPGFSLYQRLQNDDKYSLCYRIETGMCSYLMDELPPGSHLFEGGRRSQPTVYKFSDILTPIGMLQLQVQYRPTLTMNDTTDTNRKTTAPSHTIQVNRRNIYPQPRSTLSRSQSSPTLHEQHDLLASPGNRLNLIPTLCISPFKSPSLTPLPQKTQSSTPPTSNSNFCPIVEKSKSSTVHHYGSSSKKGEFLPSFDRYKNSSSSSRQNTSRYLQKSVDEFNLLIDQDNGLEEFVRLVNAKPKLKLFQESKGSEQVDTTLNGRSTLDDGALWSPLGCSSSGSCETGSLERSKSTLDYFHTLKCAHSDLSESMASDLTITNSFPTTPLLKDDSINNDFLTTTHDHVKQRQQQRSISSGTKSVMGTLVEEEGPLSP